MTQWNNKKYDAIEVDANESLIQREIKEELIKNKLWFEQDKLFAELTLGKAESFMDSKYQYLFKYVDELTTISFFRKEKIFQLKESNVLRFAEYNGINIVGYIDLDEATGKQTFSNKKFIMGLGKDLDISKDLYITESVLDYKVLTYLGFNNSICINSKYITAINSFNNLFTASKKTFFSEDLGIEGLQNIIPPKLIGGSIHSASIMCRNKLIQILN